MAGKSAGFKNGQSECVIGLLCQPTKIDTLHANQEDSVGDLVGSTAIGGVQAGNSAPRLSASQRTFFFLSLPRFVFYGGEQR